MNGDHMAEALAAYCAFDDARAALTLRGLSHDFRRSVEQYVELFVRELVQSVDGVLSAHARAGKYNRWWVPKTHLLLLRGQTDDLDEFGTHIERFPPPGWFVRELVAHARGNAELDGRWQRGDDALFDTLCMASYDFGFTQDAHTLWDTLVSRIGLGNAHLHFSSVVLTHRFDFVKRRFLLRCAVERAFGQQTALWMEERLLDSVRILRGAQRDQAPPSALATYIRLEARSARLDDAFCISCCGARGK